MNANQELPWWRFQLFITIIVGLSLRFASILSFPVFNDEAIYGLWARSILSNELLISYSDGKQPFYYWLSAFMTGLLNDPILGLRVVSALAGVAGIVGIYLAGNALAGRKVGIYAAWIYAILPYALLNDRFGLPDGMVAAAGAFVFWAAIHVGRNWLPGLSTGARSSGLMGRRAGLRSIFLLAATLGIAMLVKITALLLIPAAVLGIVAGRLQTDANGADDIAGRLQVPPKSGPAGQNWRTQHTGLSPAYLAGALKIAVIPVILALVPTVVLIVTAPSPGPSVVGKSSSFLLTAGDLNFALFSRWVHNFELLSNWFINYIRWPSLIIVCGALIAGRKRPNKNLLVVLLAGAAPVAVMAVVARTWFSRYVFLCAPFAVLAVVLAIVNLSELRQSGWFKKLITAALLILISVGALSQDTLLIRKPSEFAWAADDRWQYIEGWPSGYGLNDAVDYLKRSAKATPDLTVLVDQNIGFPRDGLLLAGFSKPIRFVDGTKHLPKIHDEKRLHLYIVDEPRLNQPRFLRDHRNWMPVASFPKPGKKSSWQIYKFHHRPKKKKLFKR